MISTTVRLARRGEVGTVTVDAVYPTDAADLWSALTDPERLARWIARVDGEPRLGATLSLELTSGWAGTGRVEECEPERRLVLVTTDGAGASTITATLSPAEGGTRLVIEETDVPTAQLPGYGGGWTLHLEDLGTFLRGGEREPMGPRWERLAPRMAEVGIEDLGD